MSISKHSLNIEVIANDDEALLEAVEALYASVDGLDPGEVNVSSAGPKNAWWYQIIGRVLSDDEIKEEEIIRAGEQRYESNAGK